MAKRAGGKVTKSHSTVLAGAAIITDIAHTCDAVKKISLGIISTSRGTGGRGKRVKILRDGFSLRLAISDGAGHQILYIHVTDIQVAAQHIEQNAKKAGFTVEMVL